MDSSQCKTRSSRVVVVCPAQEMDGLKLQFVKKDSRVGSRIEAGISSRG